MRPDVKRIRPADNGTDSKITGDAIGTSLAPSANNRTGSAAMSVYEAGIVKRARATKGELEQRRTTLVEIARKARPATVRHIYYRAVVEGLVPKSQNGYQRVGRDLVELRKAGAIPYHWIEDTGRRAHHPLVDYSAGSALRWAALSFRRNPWQDSAAPRIEIWCESRSIAGTLRELVDQYAVPVFPIGGQTSDSFAFEAASMYATGRTTIVLYAGDYDPAGQEVASQLEGKLRHHAKTGVQIEFRTLSITEEQADSLQILGTAPKKRTWRDFAGGRHEFRGQSIELEAVDPVLLRRMFSEAIEQIALENYGYDVFAENASIEAVERARLTDLADQWGGGRND